MSEEGNGSGSGFISWRWLTPVLLGLLITIGTGFAKSISADVDHLKTEQAEQKATVDLRIQSLEFQVTAVRAAQERDHKLIVLIARRMGIEVAE